MLFLPGHRRRRIHRIDEELLHGDLGRQADDTVGPRRVLRGWLVESKSGRWMRKQRILLLRLLGVVVLVRVADGKAAPVGP